MEGDPLEKVHLKRTKRLLAGHLWVFSNELFESPKKYEPGSLVEVYDRRESFLGIGYINPASLISIRLLTMEQRTIDRQFFRERILDAVRLRERMAGAKNGLRLVYSEADFLPGLIVDLYGSCIVVQLLTYGMERLKQTILELLDEILQPSAIVVRNDSRTRTLEGLPLYKEVTKGDLATLPLMQEDGLFFEVDPLEGQKTGFFLDQAENRRALAGLVQGGSGLDLFSYSGAWSVRLASRGAMVTAVDSSVKAVERGVRNAELNGVRDRVKFATEDVFSFLDGELQRKAKYDFIVCDPPAFVKSSEKLREGVRAYTDLNEKCMRLLRKAGILASSSCSYHLGRELFLDMLRSAAKRAERRVRAIEVRSQARDHPVLLAMPETEYLKCAFLLVG